MRKIHRLFGTMLFALMLHNSFAQQCKVYGLHTEDFESTPWYGNNQYLLDFLGDRGYYQSPQLRSHCPTIRYQLPVRIVIFRNNAHDASIAYSIIR